QKPDGQTSQEVIAETGRRGTAVPRAPLSRKSNSPPSAAMPAISPPEAAGRLSVALVVRRKAARLDVLAVALEGPGHDLLELRIAPDEARPEPREDSEHVVCDQDLAVAVRSRT